MVSDNDLVRQILARDKKALYKFYRHYKIKLIPYIKSRVDNPSDVEEIFQDTLYGFLEALRDFHGRCSLSTYLYSICSRKIADFYRKKKLKQLLFSHSPRLEALISPLLTPEDEMDTKLLRHRVYKALDKLLPRYRKILLLKYADDITVDDIAGKFMVTAKSIESALFRAKKAFVKAFISI